MFMGLTREKLNKIVTTCLRSLGNKSTIIFFPVHRAMQLGIMVKWILMALVQCTN